MMEGAPDHTAPVANETSTTSTDDRKASRLRSRRRVSRTSVGLASDSIVSSSSSSSSHQRQQLQQPLPQSQSHPQQVRRSTVRTEALRSRGPQRGSSRVRTSAMPRQSSAMDQGLTRTGRPKKALKGVHGAHPCLCGRVRLCFPPPLPCVRLD